MMQIVNDANDAPSIALLEAVAELAEQLDVTRLQAVTALTSVVQKRAEAERLRKLVCIATPEAGPAPCSAQVEH